MSLLPIQVVTGAGANPFAVLSLIVAPAILTNATSLLAMSTSNRLARAVDRARELTVQLEGVDAAQTPVIERRLKELTAAEQRALMLIAALRSFYTALGGFASAALLSLVGSVIVTAAGAGRLVFALEIIAVGTGVLAVGALIHGSVLLVRETSIAMQVLQDRAAAVRARMSR